MVNIYTVLARCQHFSGVGIPGGAGCYDSGAMRRVNALFDDYAEYHRTAGNKWFHRFGIPMIMLSLLGMLARVVIFANGSLRIDLAVVLILAASLYYLILDWRLGLAMTGASILFYIAGAALPMSVNVALFILGWIFQFIGH